MIFQVTLGIPRSPEYLRILGVQDLRMVGSHPQWELGGRIAFTQSAVQVPGSWLLCSRASLPRGAHMDFSSWHL